MTITVVGVRWSAHGGEERLDVHRLRQRCRHRSVHHYVEVTSARSLLRATTTGLSRTR
ncbi:MAG: hypothetical protein WKF82_06345 [Nocardioidaceae bacterium]